MTEQELDNLTAGIPTYKDVENWCRARMSPVDPLDFFRFYERRNWKTKSGEDIKNWRYIEKLWEEKEMEWIESNRNKMTAKSSNPFLRYIQESEA